jgi:cell division septum initiation protein DivIVA
MLQHSNHSAITDDTRSSILADRFIPPAQVEVDCLPVLTAIEQLEDTILNSPRVPLTGKTIVNEEELLEQLDSIRANLPEIVDRAREILEYKDLLIREAQQQAQQMISEATQRAYQIANELGIIDRAEQEATRIRQITLSECEQLRQQTTIEMERVRNHNINEIERVRHQVMVECEDVQDGADAYADRILHDLEHQLSTTLQSIQQGRQRLNIETARKSENV